jgi:MFS family permease
MSQTHDKPGTASSSPPANPPLGSAEPGRNEKILFWASFLTLIAAGIGFSVRGAILGEWGKQFGLTQSDLGGIQGFGLVGFGFTIITLSFVADRIGYAPLMVLAFLLHFSSGVITLAATPVFNAYGKDAAYWCLAIGGMLYSLANGTCEAVINPLTATLYPRNKTHWLNILHAGWPGGLILGALLTLVLAGVRWEVKMGIFLVPTLMYGLMMVGRKFPRSEASVAGVSVATMLLEFASPILLFLILLHAMVGFVELGTDSWIQNITGTILKSGAFGTMLFIWTSSLMFILRFFAGPIVHKISPLGLLFFSAVLGCCGLLLLGQAGGIVACVLAATIYGFGKTFFWPTMLGVVSERFPKGGAITLGMVGGVGMLSAGLLGGPGIGYMQDYAASNFIKDKDPGAYTRYEVEKPESYLFFPPVAGLDNAKVGVLKDDGKTLREDIATLEKTGRKLSDDANLASLESWWEKSKPYAPEDKPVIEQTQLNGGQKALTWTAAVPAMMALGYLLLILYFRAIGGYKAQVLVGHAADDEKFTGGTEGPGEG